MHFLNFLAKKWQIFVKFLPSPLLVFPPLEKTKKKPAVGTVEQIKNQQKLQNLKYQIFLVPF